METYNTLFMSALSQSFAHGDRGLDLGCGSGKLAIAMAHKGLVVDAVDTNKNELEHLSIFLKDKPLPIHVVGEDVRYFSFATGVYRLVFARNVLPFLADKHEVSNVVIKSIDSLVPGGEFVFTLFGHRDGWAGRTDMSFFEAEEVVPILNDRGVTVVDRVDFEDDAPTKKGVIKHWHIHAYRCRKEQ